MRALRSAALALALVLSAPATAQAPAAQIVSQVEAKYKDVTAIQARFTQTVSSPSFGENVQKGTLQLQRPKKARWEFQEPNKSAMITNGQTMWVWTPDTKQVIVTEDLSAGGGGSDLMVLLTDLSRLEEFFTVEASQGEADEHVLSLVPKDDALKAQLSQLQLVLVKDSMVLKNVSFADSFGQKTRLDFEDVDLAPSFADGTFDFKPPADATVINTGGL